MIEIYTQFWHSTWWFDKVIAIAIYFLFIYLLLRIEKKFDK